MHDRVMALVAEHAATKRLPSDRLRVYAAVNDLIRMLIQARDRLIAGDPPPAPQPAPQPAPPPEPVPQPAPAPQLEEDTAEP